MNVIVLEDVPTSGRGGQEHSLLDICRGLAGCGHGIHLLYREEGDLLEEYRQFCLSTLKVDGYGIAKEQLAGSVRDWIRSLLVAKSIQADVVYVNQYHDTFFGGALARLKRIPLVCHLRLFPPDRFCGQWRLGLNSVTRFIAGSESTRAAYLEAGFCPTTMEVVHNGIDIDRFAPGDDRLQTRRELGIPLNAFTVIYAGRIDRPKNLEMLLDAFAGLSLPPDNGRLLVVGGGVVHDTVQAGQCYLEELKAHAQNLGISDSVHWLGRRRDIPELFRAADVLVLPSKLPETFGRTLIESMACGTPALGTGLGGIPEVLCGEFSRFCFNNGETPRLTALLGDLQRWRETDQDLGWRCRQHVIERFTIDKTVARVEAELTKAIGIGPKRLGPSPGVLKRWNNGTWMVMKTPA